MERVSTDVVLVIGSSTLRAMNLIQDPRIRSCIKPASTVSCFINPNHVVTLAVKRFLKQYTCGSYNILGCLIYFGNSSQYVEGAGMMAAYELMFEQHDKNEKMDYKPVVERADKGVQAMLLMLRKYLNKAQPISMMLPLPASYTDPELLPYMRKYRSLPVDGVKYERLVRTLVGRMGGDMWCPMRHINQRMCKRVASETGPIKCFDLWQELTNGKPVVQGQRAVLDAYSNTDALDISCHLNFEAVLPLMLRRFSEQTGLLFKYDLEALRLSRAIYQAERDSRPHKQPTFQSYVPHYGAPIRFISGGLL